MVGQRGSVRGGIEADHVNADPLDDSPENLVAACGDCNRDRQAYKVRDDEQFITRRNGTRLRALERVCLTCGKAFLVAKSEIASGRGAYCSRRCMYDRHRSGLA